MAEKGILQKENIPIFESWAVEKLNEAFAHKGMLDFYI